MSVYIFRAFRVYSRVEYMTFCYVILEQKLEGFFEVTLIPSFLFKRVLSESFIYFHTPLKMPELTIEI